MILNKNLTILLVFVLLSGFSSSATAKKSIGILNIFIPANQGFDFSERKIVDSNKGDIVPLSYGIETVDSYMQIAQIDKGFLEDFNGLPEEELIRWSNFAEYSVGMIYAVKCANGKYALFELIHVTESGDGEVLGMEIDYKYQS